MASSDPKVKALREARMAEAKRLREAAESAVTQAAAKLLPRLAEKHAVADKVDTALKAKLIEYEERIVTLKTALDAHILRWAVMSQLGELLSDPIYAQKVCMVLSYDDVWWTKTRQQDRSMRNWIEYINDQELPTLEVIKESLDALLDA